MTSPTPPEKKPCEFKSVFVPNAPGSNRGHWTECPGIKEVGGDMECERYRCDTCGKSYTLYYDEMR